MNSDSNYTENEVNDILLSIGKTKVVNNKKTPNKKTPDKKTINKKTPDKKTNDTSKDIFQKMPIIEEDMDEDEEDKNLKTFNKNGYTRPELTFTDQLSKEQIEERLEDYIKIDDIAKIPIGTHLRYFTKKDDKLIFRMGGQLFRNNGIPEYIILKNGINAQWSVQIKDTIFYRKMTVPEIKDEYEKIIKNLIEKNKKLKNKIRELENK